MAKTSLQLVDDVGKLKNGAQTNIEVLLNILHLCRYDNYAYTTDNNCSDRDERGVERRMVRLGFLRRHRQTIRSETDVINFGDAKVTLLRRTVGRN